MAVAALAERNYVPRGPVTPSASAFSAAIQPSWERYVIARMERLVSLPECWDGYEGRPVRVDTGIFAIQLLIETLDPSSPHPQIVPLSYGGVQIEWHEQGMDLEIEVIAPHDMIVSYADAVTGAEDEFPLSTDVTRLSKILGDLTARATR